MATANEHLIKEITALLSDQGLQEQFLAMDDSFARISNALHQFPSSLTETIFSNKPFMKRVNDTPIASSYILMFAKLSIKVAEFIFTQDNDEAKTYLSTLLRNPLLNHDYLVEIAKIHESMIDVFIGDKTLRGTLLGEDPAYTLTELGEKHLLFARKIINNQELRDILLADDKPGYLLYLLANAHSEIFKEIDQQPELKTKAEQYPGWNDLDNHRISSDHVQEEQLSVAKRKPSLSSR